MNMLYYIYVYIYVVHARSNVNVVLSVDYIPVNYAGRWLLVSLPQIRSNVIVFEHDLFTD